MTRARTKASEAEKLNWTNKHGRISPAVWAIRDSALNSSEKLTLYTLIAIASVEEDGWEAFPALDTLAIQTGLSKRCVIDTTRRIEEYGLIERQIGGGRRSTLYTLDFHAIADLPRHPKLPPPKQKNKRK